MHTIKRTKNTTITILLIIAIVLSFLFGGVGFKRTARADESNDTVEFPPTELGISNPHFETSSGSYPASPSSWTGASVGNGSGNVISGVVDLSDSYFGNDSGNTKFKLDQYPEYAEAKNKPQTIFGAGTKYAGSDEKTLLVNTAPGAEVAYAYTSSDMTFAANSFYRVSAWVKTGDFAQGTGATIKLTGLEQNCSFMNINTVKNLPKTDGIPQLNADNNYGWVKYTFYVRTSAAYSRTVKLSLGIGDAALGNDEDHDTIMPRAAKGYAFFDTVSAERISAHDFATETLGFDAIAQDKNIYTNRTGTSLAIDLYELDSLTVDGKEIGTFSQNLDMWQHNVPYYEYEDDTISTGVAHSKEYNSERRIIDFESATNINGFTKNPWAPYGRAEYESVTDEHGNINKMFDGANTANIMMINTYDGKDFQKAAYGIASPTVKIDRFKYYRFSVWVKSDSVEGSSGISILVKGKRNGAQNYKTIGNYSGLAGDSTDNAHYGWKEQIVYIRGSMLYDYEAKFELWLGTPASLASGIAMFDNVTFTELSYSEYTGMSGADGGNSLTIDSSATDTGITNGSFQAVGDYDEFKFPLPVANWTYVTPDTAGTTGFSTAAVNTDNAVYGIIPTDAETFDEVRAEGLIPNVTNPSTMDADMKSVAILSSTTPTAIGYKSSSFTLASGKGNKITAEIAVDKVTQGNGAALVLKNDSGNVLSTIQNIKTTNNAFKTFTFYMDAPAADQSVTLELWLGMGDRSNNLSNLSNGNVYIRQVSVEEWTVDESSSIEAEYGKVLESYKQALLNDATLNALDYSVYSFGAPTFDYYDAYSYGNNNAYGIPYQWSVTSANSNVKSGTFNTENMKGISVYDGFNAKDYSGNMLHIFNTDINRTTYTYNNAIVLGANLYYRLDVTLKVRVTDEVRLDTTSIGANLKLSNTTAEFTNIKDTTTLLEKGNEESRDYETFKTYSFYISTGDEGGSTSLEISFGGSTRAEYIQGHLVVANIGLTEIDNLDYENAQAIENDEDDKDHGYVATASLSETADEEPDDDNTEAPSSEIQWWIIPTVIFSTALLAVVIIIIVLRLRDFFKKKKKVTYSSEYDRGDTIRDLDKLQKEQELAADKANEQSVPDLNTEKTELDDYDEPVEQTPETEEIPEDQNAQTEEQPETPTTDEQNSEVKANDEKSDNVKSDSDDLDD